MAIIDDVKTLLNISGTTKDALLNLLISQAEEEAETYTHRDDIEEFPNIIVQMCVYKFNRLGTEGVTGESYSGVSYNYSADYPEGIMRQLKRIRKVQVISNDSAGA